MSRRWTQRVRDGLDSARPAHDLRVARGRFYRRSGRVVDLRVEAGLLVGRVQGSRSTPYSVRIEVPVLEPPAWDEFVSAVAGQARHAARLLAGLAPEGLEQQLDAAGVDIFPSGAAARFSCECADEARPCAHAVALWDEAAERVGTDPGVLFRLRGRGRQQLLAEVAAARQRTQRRPAPRDGIGLDDLDAARWWQARSALEDVAIPPGTPPAIPAPALRLAGDPPGWAGGVGAWALLHPLVDRAGAWAGEVGVGR